MPPYRHFFIFFCFFLIWTFDITIPVDVSNAAGSPGESFIQTMEKIQTPFGRPYFAVSRHSPGSIDVTQTTSYLVLVEIPPEFIWATGSNSVGAIRVHYGAIQENSTKNYINRLREAETYFYIENGLDNPIIAINEIRHYPVDPPVRQAMGVGIIAMALLLAGGIFGGIIVAREFEEQTMKIVRISPVNRLIFLASKGSLGLLLTLTSGVIYILLAVGLLTEAWPARLDLFLATFFLLGSIGVLLGLIYGLLVKGVIPVFIIALVSSLAMWLLGGGFGSLTLYSALHRSIVQFLPYTHGMNLFYHCYFGDGPVLVKTSLVKLVLILVVALVSLILLTWKSFEKEK